jgi:hypothetical protein
MKHFLSGLVTLCVVMVVGCSDDVVDQSRSTGNDSPPGSRPVAGRGRPFWFEQAANHRNHVAQEKGPNSHLAQVPATKRKAPPADPVEPVGHDQPARTPLAPQRAVQHKPVVERNDDAQTKPRAVSSAPRQVAGKPRRKRVAGIDWHVSLPAVLKEASAAPNGGKPVLCFRVLGDLSGFM